MRMLMLFLWLSLAALAAPSLSKAFLGTWKLDHKATIAYAKQDKSLSNERRRALIEEMKDGYDLTVYVEANQLRNRKISYDSSPPRSSEVSHPIRVLSVKGGQATLAMQVGGDSDRVTLTLLNDGHLLYRHQASGWELVLKR